jgi:hypothetical protein
LTSLEEPSFGKIKSAKFTFTMKSGKFPLIKRCSNSSHPLVRFQTVAKVKVLHLENHIKLV